MDIGASIYRVGASVGLVGGAVFVLANRGALDTPFDDAALLVWAAAALGAVWAVWLRRSTSPRRPGTVGPRPGLVYGVSCLAMLALIQVGSRILTAQGLEQAVPAMIVLAVGLHFLPFRRAFGVPLFTRLGATIAPIGAVGIALHVVAGAPAGAVAAVLAGLVMTALIGADSLAPEPSDPRTPGRVPAP